MAAVGSLGENGSEGRQGVARKWNWVKRKGCVPGICPLQIVVLQFGRKLQKNGDGLEENSEKGKKELGGGLWVHRVRLSP